MSYDKKMNVLNIYIKDLFKKIGIIKILLYCMVMLLYYSLFSLQPYFLPRIYESTVEGKYKLNYIYLLLTFVTFMSTSMMNYPNNYFLQCIRKYTKQLIWERNKEKNYSYFINKEVGNIQNLISEISRSVRNIQYEIIQVIIKSFVMIIIYTVLLYSYSTILSVSYAVSYLIFFLMSCLLSKENKKGIKEVLRSSSKINAYTIDYYKNIDTIITNKSFGLENSIYDKLLDDEKASYYNLQKKIDNSHLLQQVILTVITLMLLIMKAYFKKNSVADISFLLILIYSAFNLSSFGKAFLSLLEYKDRIKVALEMLEYGKSDKTSFRNFKEISDDKAPCIQLVNLSFSYNDKPVIKNINLSINNKDKIAIIGKNGSGKSTLLKLIAGLLTNYQGEIIWNKKSNLDFNEIRYYSQSANLFDRSIYENMIYPKESYPIEEVKKLVKKLNLNSLVTNEEDLLNKTPGDFGAKFSGGEKQKILIARAIVNKAPIVLFDEITASLDKQTDTLFAQILDEYFEDSIVICATHKKVGIETFNKVYDLDAK
ncbi:ABC transporter ATP-binding protein [Thermoanaerobacterium sp. RBIITD]|uniref:ATP-binding cassette domain-containing protein n=1 Tax=Thermoanaerobacterium sp. RBIITD TaxID=1550240 RepID=UPI000BB9194B|nr:ABC transporter ATP-binding protein [Thermoanaerobacterium sp. RBIITD]SNX52617.1 ATP-binding cassette, subfamily B, AbcA/BmrA [Thermoanaerobacterium sp. RBIITD]